MFTTLQDKRVSATEAGKNYLTITNGRLTINDPQRDRDTAPFWCEAFNEFGRIISEKGRIDFISKSSIQSTHSCIVNLFYYIKARSLCNASIILLSVNQATL